MELETIMETQTKIFLTFEKNSKNSEVFGTNAYYCILVIWFASSHNLSFI